MLADQVRDAITAAPTMRTLDDVARVMWRAFSEGAVTDADAAALSAAVEARRAILRVPGPARAGRPPAGRMGRDKSSSQRSPDRQRSIERRRRLAASGPLPPALAASFTTGQLAVLRIVGDEVKARGRCTRSLGELAARAGVCRRTAQAALREAERLGLVHIAEHRRTPWMNAPNTVTVISREWLSWLRLTRPGTRMQKSAEHGQQSISGAATAPPIASGTRRDGFGIGRGGGGNGPPDLTPRRI